MHVFLEPNRIPLISKVLIQAKVGDWFPNFFIVADTSLVKEAFRAIWTLVIIRFLHSLTDFVKNQGLQRKRLQYSLRIFFCSEKIMIYPFIGHVW